MDIHFSKQQFLHLMQLVYLGDWMINAQRTGCGGNEIREEYKEITKRIYSRAEEEGYGKYVHYDEELNEWFPSQEFEMDSEVALFHKEYDDGTFWNEIADRFAERDFFRTYGGEKIQKMSLEEQIEKEQPFIEKYSEEIANNGIQHFEILKTIPIEEQ